MRKINPLAWRRWIGVAGTVLGLFLLATAGSIYLRYASNPANMYVEERLLHVEALGMLLRLSFFGSMVLFVSSLFGLGWFRVIGLAANAGAFVCVVMIVGALCGPFNC